jgi:hypothetical protein
VGAGARHAGADVGRRRLRAHGGGDWGGTRAVVGGHGCARWRRVRGRLRAWPGAAACMAVGVGAGRGGGCAHGRVPVAAGAAAGAGARGGNQTVSDGGGVGNRTVEMEAGAWLC